MSDYHWTSQFQKLYDKALTAYSNGNRDASTFFDQEEQKFLASIGHIPQQLHDYAEVLIVAQTLDYSTALLITAVRRDYFLVVQKGVPSTQTLPDGPLPSKTDTIEGIEWLPLLIRKAQARLRGELPIQTMYSCSGDLRFLKKYDIHPADFLRHIWNLGNQTDKIVAFVKSRAPASV